MTGVGRGHYLWQIFLVQQMNLNLFSVSSFCSNFYRWEYCRRSWLNWCWANAVSNGPTPNRESNRLCIFSRDSFAARALALAPSSPCWLVCCANRTTSIGRPIPVSPCFLGWRCYSHSWIVFLTWSSSTERRKRVSEWSLDAIEQHWIYLDAFKKGFQDAYTL